MIHCVSARPAVRLPVALVLFGLSAVVASVGCDAPPDTFDYDDEPGDEYEAIAAAAVEETAATARTPAIVRQLEAATEGLLFTSESDYPLTVRYWAQPGGRPDAERVAELTGNAGKVVEEKSLAALLEGATTAQPWHSPEELESVRRYQQLERLLRKKLRFIRVFRYGTIEIHTVVVGVTRNGSWAGFSTVQIET